MIQQRGITILNILVATILCAAAVWFWALSPLGFVSYLASNGATDADLIRQHWPHRLIQPEWLSPKTDRLMTWHFAETFARLSIIAALWLVTAGRAIYRIIKRNVLGELKKVNAIGIACVALLVGCVNYGDEATTHCSILRSVESIAVLNAAASNPLNGQGERARAVFTLWVNHISPSASVAEMRKVFPDAAWLNESRLYGVRELGGKIPVGITPADTVYCLHLFPADTDKQRSPWVIYFRLSGKLRDEDALAFLRGENVAGSTKLVEFALCFPHSSKPLTLPGRIERFSSDGIRIEREQQVAAQKKL